MRAGSPVVRAFLANLLPELRRLVAALRLLVRQTAPKAEETILRKSLSYHRPTPGGRVKGAVCLITPRSDRVNLAFIHGSALLVPEHLLRDCGKSKRFLSLRSEFDIERQALIDLLKATAEYEP